MYVEDIGEGTIEAVGGEGVHPPCNEHELANGVWVGDRAFGMQHPKLREEGEECAELRVAQRWRHLAQQLGLRRRVRVGDRVCGEDVSAFSKEVVTWPHTRS